MKKEFFNINGIPAVLYGQESEKIFLFVHGKHSGKEEAQMLAKEASKSGYQVLGFDLPEHGDRKNENYKCTVQNGVHDLQIIFNYIKQKWSSISLFGCSLGAYFSLVSYKDVVFSRCLFLSPILDMERLIKNMMLWSNVDEDILKEKREIPTEFGETLSWDYYSYVKENPIEKWTGKTVILYGSRDNLTEKDVIDSFVGKFNCTLQVVENGEHYFQSEEELKVLKEWIKSNI